MEGAAGCRYEPCRSEVKASIELRNSFNAASAEVMCSSDEMNLSSAMYGSNMGVHHMPTMGGILRH
ncbi:hypothetical protein VAR608DRAFT_2413 [Variovorax sp. HW608]|nr:hypothetical protein VAR608DRAFT_2413 [Variovorax sp. HW608]